MALSAICFGKADFAATGRMLVQLLRLFFCLFRPGIYLIILRSRPVSIRAPILSLPSVHCSLPPGNPCLLMRTPLKARIYKWTELCTGNVFKLRFHIHWLHTIRATRRHPPCGAQQRKYSPRVISRRDVYVGHHPTLSGDAGASCLIWITSLPFENDVVRAFFARSICVQSAR